MLHDFTFRSPDEVLAELIGGSVAAARELMAKAEEAPGREGGGNAPGAAMVGMAPEAPGMSMPAMGMAGSHAMHMDLNDVQYDAFLANDRTLADPEVVRVEPAGRIRLRIINGASASQFWIDLGELVGRVVATDGHGSRFPIAMAQRLDIIIDLPRSGAFPILAQLEGERRQTGIVLATAGARIAQIGDSAQPAPPVDNSLEAKLATVEPLPSRSADIVPHDRSQRQHETLCLVHERRVLAAGHAAHAGERATRCDRSRQPFNDGASDASARPYVPGDRNRWPADPRRGARHCSGHADGSCPNRVRRRQPGTMGVSLPQPLPHDDRDADRVQI
jgi:hypothetical protein